MRILVIVTAMVSSLVVAEPRPPMVMRLDENAIHSIPLHPESNTLLVFPEDVTLILGHHLSRGERPGRVYCQQAENAKHLVLRQLEENSTVLMQVVMGERAFVFKLAGSDHPASVIRFHAQGQAPPAVEIAPSKILNTKRTVSPKRLAELIRLTKEAAFLQPRLPHEYRGFVARRVQFSSKIRQNVSATITGLARFPMEDALVVLGRIRNDGTRTVTLGSNMRLKVGDSRHYAFSQFDLAQKTLRPGRETIFSAILVGDGKGAPLHLSLENQFSLEPNPQK